MKNNSPVPSKRTLGFGISFLVHGAILAAIATATYKVAVPPGQVTEMEVTSANTVSAPQVATNEKAPAHTEKNTEKESDSAAALQTNPDSDVAAVTQPSPTPTPPKPIKKVAVVLPVRNKHEAEKAPLVKPDDNVEKEVLNPVTDEATEETPAPVVAAPLVSDENLSQRIQKKMQQAVDAPAEEAPPVAAADNSAGESAHAENNAPQVGTTTAEAVTQNSVGEGSGTGTPTGTGSGNWSGPVQSYTALTPLAGNKKPDYPMMARLRRQTADVTILFSVKPDGTVGDVKLVSNTGEKSFAENVLKTHKAMRYKPGKAGLFQQTYNFRLNGETQEAPSLLRRGK